MQSLLETKDPGAHAYWEVGAGNFCQNNGTVYSLTSKRTCCFEIYNLLSTSLSTPSSSDQSRLSLSIDDPHSPRHSAPYFQCLSSQISQHVLNAHSMLTSIMSSGSAKTIKKWPWYANVCIPAEVTDT